MSRPCAEIEPLIALLADGGKDRGAETEVRVHVQDCAGCRTLSVDLGLLVSDFLELSTVDPDVYVIGEQIGRGGMGRIVRARDRRLGRIVALKLLLHEELRERFEHEARLTSRLSHPSIVNVYEAGRWPSGEPFYAMRYVAGKPLDRVLAATRTIGERLALLPTLVTVAEAIAYAHSLGIIHRDLKPQNILLGEFGEAVVIDWGLAKDLRASDSTPAAGLSPSTAASLTQAGAGTPLYMPPEQAAGDPVDERADVFALGATLYHLLSGQLPAGEGLTLGRVTPPPPLLAVDPAIPRELAAVVAKAMSTDPEARYASARELADELRRFQTGRLLESHRYTLGELVLRWVRRHRALLLAAGLFVLALAALGALSLRSIIAARDRAEAEHAAADAQRAAVQREAARAAYHRDDLLAARAHLRASLETQDSPLARALAWQLDAEPGLWSRELGDVIAGVAFSPDGERIAVGALAGRILLLDARTAEHRVVVDLACEAPGLAFDPTGAFLATGDRLGRVSIVELATGRVRQLGRGGAFIGRLVMSPDGKTVYSADEFGEVVRWDVATGRSQTFGARLATTTDLDLTSDGRWLAHAGADGGVTLLDTAAPSNPPLRVFQHGQRASAVAFDRGGTRVASGGRDGSVHIWNLATGEQQASFRWFTTPVRSLEFAADGRLGAASPTNGEIVISDLGPGPELRLRANERGIYAFAFAPDGTRVVSANDGVLSLWEVMPRPPSRPHLPSGTGVGLEFSPDGRSLYSAIGNEVSRWDVGTGELRVSRRAGDAIVAGLAIDRAGARIVGVSLAGSIHVWEPPLLVERRLFRGGVSLNSVSLSSSGQTALVGGVVGDASLWDLETGQILRVMRGHGGATFTVMAHHSQLAATSSWADPMVRLWDTSTGRELMLLEGHREGVLAVSFSPDDRRLATGANDDEVRVWDLATGKSQLLGTHDGDVFGIGFDPSGTRLASASGDRTARVWELASGRHLELRGHRADVNRVVFSPDGKRVATLGDDALRLWDAETGAPAWRTVLLRETVPEIYTQRGWTTLAGQPLAGAGESWRQAVASAVLASEREGRVCVATRSGTVEIWTPSIDRLRVEEQVGEVEALVATSDGCVALSGGRAVFVGATSKELTTGATALASDGDEILVGVPNAVRRFGPEGRSRGEVPLLHTPTSLTQGFAGTSAGTLQRFEGFAPSLEDAPASAVTAVAEGPPGIVVLGFSQGLVGLWDLTTGGRLEAWQLHGPVTNIVLVGHELRMASELGDWRVANLDAFYLDHCEVLRRLWRRTPVAVDEGRIVLRAPPVDHACAKRVD